MSRRQDALISALLLAPTLAEAAQTAGIGEATAWRWLKDKAFRNAYREARREVVRQAVAQVQQACSIAVTTLTAVMQALRPQPVRRWLPRVRSLRRPSKR